MQFEYTMTLDDVIEATNPNVSVKRRSKPWHALLNWLPLLFLFVLNAGYGRSKYENLARLGELSNAETPRNLWVTLVPMLVISTRLALTSVKSAWNRRLLRRAKTSGRNIKPNLVWAQLFSALPLLWIIPAVWPGMEIYWLPTDGQILWAAFTPWLLYSALAGYYFIRRREMAVVDRWNQSKSMHRSVHVEITPQGVLTDDGITRSQIKWSHYKRFGETDNLILLINENGGTTFVAKRSVTDEAAMDEMRMLIHSNIADGEFKNRRNSFPVVLQVLEIPEGM